MKYCFQIKKLIVTLLFLTPLFGFSQTDSLSKKVPIPIKIIDTPPLYPGGELMWKSYVEKNINTKIPIENGAPSHTTYRVVVKFTINKEGVLTNIKPLSHCGFGMEEEVVRILGNSIKWSPAKSRGEAVTVELVQSFKFYL